MQIQGKTALLTGATGGIGQAIARALSAEGARVIVSGRRSDVLDELVASLGGEHHAHKLVADLADADSARRALATAGEVDILVVNHALPASGKLDDFDADSMQRQLDVNLVAPIALAHAVVPSMVERGEGHLVFISSIAGKVASGGGSLYAATKFGLRGFATSLHDELLDAGVGVTTVFPGFISEAGMFHDANLELPPGVGTRTPDQVAAAVVTGIKKNRNEIDVAPLSLRAGAWIGGVSQSAVQAMQRAAGSRKFAAALAEGQRDKRA